MFDLRMRGEWQKQMIRGLLVATLLAFVLGHVLTSGAMWDYIAARSFSPWNNYVSDYAYRSPVWWLFTGCMLSFATVLGWFAWRVFAGSSRTLLHFLAMMCFAYGAVSLVEVAVFPVKPPEIGIEELQSRLDAGAWARVKRFVTEFWNERREHSAWEVFSVVLGHNVHFFAIRRSMIAMLLGMGTSLLLTQTRRTRLMILGCLAFALVTQAVALATHRQWLPGLWQRLGFLAVFVWMWLLTPQLARSKDLKEGVSPTPPDGVSPS